jgi:hypothetical protein
LLKRPCMVSGMVNLGLYQPECGFPAGKGRPGAHEIKLVVDVSGEVA